MAIDDEERAHDEIEFGPTDPRFLTRRIRVDSAVPAIDSRRIHQDFGLAGQADREFDGAMPSSRSWWVIAPLFAARQVSALLRLSPVPLRRSTRGHNVAPSASADNRVGRQARGTIHYTTQAGDKRHWGRSPNVTAFEKMPPELTRRYVLAVLHMTPFPRHPASPCGRLGQSATLGQARLMWAIPRPENTFRA